MVASSWVCRTAISASASISARFFLLTAMISASLRRPTALKALFSSKPEKADWSRRVSETQSSRMPFWLEILAQQVGDVAHEIGAVLMQRIHGVAGRDRMDRVDEAAFQQIAHAVGREGFRAERLRGGRDALGRGRHAHVEFELDVDPHAVFGDQ